MEQQSWMQKLRVAACWTLVYLAWAFTSALALLDVLALRRTVLSLFVAFQLEKWAFAAVDKWLFLIMGLAWLVSILFVLYYYNRVYPGSTQLRPLLKPFLTSTAIELAIVGVSFIVRLLVPQSS